MLRQKGRVVDDKLRCPRCGYELSVKVSHRDDIRKILHRHGINWSPQVVSVVTNALPEQSDPFGLACFLNDLARQPSNIFNQMIGAMSDTKIYTHVFSLRYWEKLLSSLKKQVEKERKVISPLPKEV